MSICPARPDKGRTSDKKRTELRKGANGEAAVAFILDNLPDSFCVINDLSTKKSNIDHLVVGPTGVFALDTKTWRGIISPDGNGELLLSGRPRMFFSSMPTLSFPVPESPPVWV